MSERLRRLLFPDDPVYRALTIATVAASLSTGLFYSVSALYFTHVIGLSATSVGLGLTVAGATGVAASFGAGYLADRLGADRLQLGATAAQGAALFAYVLASDVVVFTLVACVAVGGRSMQGTAKAALQARWFTGEERIEIRARLRVVTNVFIGLGTVLAGVALLLDSAAGYRSTMILVGALTTAATIPLSRLRRVPGFAARMSVGPARDGGRGPSPLRDRPYVASVLLNSVIAMQFGLSSVGVPLWIVTRTEAPSAVISMLLVLNTVLVALFQVAATRGTHDIGVAGRTIRRGSLLLAASCLLFAAAGSVGAVSAVVLLVVAEVAATWAEIWCEAGGWGLAFELADPRSAGAYQGLTQTGYSLANMVAPAFVTITAVDHGLAGWAVLAVLFAGCGTAAAAVARRAAARRGSGTPELEPVLSV